MSERTTAAGAGYSGPVCLYCPHKNHGTQPCGIVTCKCKGKPGRLARFIDKLGESAADLIFGPRE